MFIARILRMDVIYAVAVNLNKVGFNFYDRPIIFINRITFRFRCFIKSPLFIRYSYFWWAPLDCY